MKLAIMQPYFFPYIGYFQLINAVDKFVFYDDVNFIKKGWINRNRILVNSKEHLFTIPLIKSSQNKLIKDTEISDETNWRGTLLKTIEMSYKKAPYFNDTFNLIEEVFNREYLTINLLAKESVKRICKYISIDTEIVDSSTKYDNNELQGQQRIISICKNEFATTYINSEGGKIIYSIELFKENLINIKFIKSIPLTYTQFSNSFTPFLSIIDLLMHNSNFNIQKHLASFTFIE